jgi:hypothetical protein
MNHLLITPNEIFSEYFDVSDNLTHFTDSVTEGFDLNNDVRTKLCINHIMESVVENYSKVIIASKLTNPYVVINTL